MSNLDDPNDPPANGEPDNGTNRLGRDELEHRLRELERENTRLRDELNRVTALRQQELKELHAHQVRGMPATQAEWRKMVAEAVPGGDYLRELVAKLERPE